MTDQTISILGIDDDMTMKWLLEKACVKAGLNYHHAFNKKQSIELLKNKNIDTIILDINIGSENGLDFFDDPEFAELTKNKIIIVNSSNDEPETKKKSIQKGANLFLAKPLKLNEVVYHLSSLNAKVYQKEQKKVKLIVNANVESISLDSVIIKSPIKYRSGQELHLSGKNVTHLFSSNILFKTKLDSTFVSKGKFQSVVNLYGLSDFDVQKLLKKTYVSSKNL